MFLTCGKLQMARAVCSEPMEEAPYQQGYEETVYPGTAAVLRMKDEVLKDVTLLMKIRGHRSDAKEINEQRRGI